MPPHSSTLPRPTNFVIDCSASPSASNRTPGRAPHTPQPQSAAKPSKTRLSTYGARICAARVVCMAIACKEWSKLSWRHLRATNILRLPVEIASPQGQSNRRNLARSIEIPGYVLSGHGVNTCDHVYEEPLMPALRHSPRPGDQRKHNSLISSTPAATSNGLERAMQKVIGLTISPQPTQTDAGQSTTRRFRVTQTGTGEPLNKP